MNSKYYTEIKKEYPDADCTLDYDQAPANGVMITTSIHSAARGVTLDFAQSPAAFAIAAEAVAK